MASFDINNFFDGLKHALIEAQKESRSPVGTSFPSNIPVYSGHPSDNLQRWIFQVTDVFDARSVPLYTRLRQVSGFLGGNALQWFINVRSDIDGGNKPPFESWDEFIEEISSYFSRSDNPLFVRRQLRQLQQKDDLHFYINSFRNLLGQAGDMLEVDKISYFTEGLRDLTKKEVLVKQPQTLNEAVKAAVTFDSLRFEDPRKAHKATGSQARGRKGRRQVVEKKRWKQERSSWQVQELIREEPIWRLALLEETR